MAEPSSSAGGFLAWKLGAGILGAGAAATALGFLVLLPKTAHEAFVRCAATLMGSALLGPFVCVAVYWKYPAFFDSGVLLAKQMGVAPTDQGLIGLLIVCAPLLAMSGLPFWWILGAIVRWFSNRQGKDIVELVEDARGALK